MKLQHAQSQPFDVNFSGSLIWKFQRLILISFRWSVNTTWFLLLLIAVLVGTSLVTSLYSDAWHWFQRSGALMVSIGAVLSTRRPLNLILDNMLVNSGSSAIKLLQNAPNQGELNETRTCVCGFIMVAIGTLIWAYGDLAGCLVNWNFHCLT